MACPACDIVPWAATNRMIETSSLTITLGETCIKEKGCHGFPFIDGSWDPNRGPHAACNTTSGSFLFFVKKQKMSPAARHCCTFEWAGETSPVQTLRIQPHNHSSAPESNNAEEVEIKAYRLRLVAARTPGIKLFTELTMPFQHFIGLLLS